jgi:pyrroloquinoline quinone biosynthesis protein E
MSAPQPPLAILAELSHRCPLRCPYCSNPVDLERAATEMSQAEWESVLRQAAALGALQVHFSGGEPTVRADLEALIACASELGLYSNLITSAVLIDRARLDALKAAGLKHVQVSFQAAVPDLADRIGGYAGGHQKKVAVAKMVRELGMALTVNAVINRHNVEQVDDMIALAVDLGAQRIEIAHVQYYGWGLRNRAALMPTRTATDAAIARVEAAAARLKGTLVIDHVVPDYYATRPKACMNGWGRRFLNVTPSGRVLPCHAAETIPGLEFQSVREVPLAEIWRHGPAFEAYRGTAWMTEPCRSCERAEIDWGGCRCQALAIAGDAAATDPACALSDHHGRLLELATTESAAAAPEFIYRQFSNAGR